MIPNVKKPLSSSSLSKDNASKAPTKPTRTKSTISDTQDDMTPPPTKPNKSKSKKEKEKDSTVSPSTKTKRTKSSSSKKLNSFYSSWSLEQYESWKQLLQTTQTNQEWWLLKIYGEGRNKIKAKRTRSCRVDKYSDAD